MLYEVEKRTDKNGDTFWYCHRKGFPNVPVFGSIGSYQKAKSVCDMYNGSVGAKRAKKERAMKKTDVLQVIDEVMNNREIDSIRNAILAIRDKVIELPDEDDWTKEYCAKLKLRGNNPLRCYGDYYDGAKYINIDTCAKNDTADYGAYWYSDE